MKKIVSFLIVFVFSFGYISLPFNTVHADTLAPSVNFIGANNIMMPNLGDKVNKIAMVAVACISAGVIFHNREQINVIAGSIYQQMVLAGKPVSVAVNGALSLSSDALDFIYNKVADIKTAKTVTGTYPVGSGWKHYDSEYSIMGMIIQDNMQIDFYSAQYGNGTFVSHSSPSTIGLPIVLYWSDYWQQNFISFGGTHAFTDWGAVDILFPSDSEQSVCVPYPDTVGSVSATPYKADQPMVIPGDSTMGSTAVPGSSTADWEGKVIGQSDWTQPFAQDVPITYPVTIPAVDGYVPSAVPVVGPVIDFFHIDFPAISVAMNFTDIWKAHFKPFYDLGTAFSNISNVPTDSTGKFYMVIPSAMGGDGQSHCVLDLTAGALFISWARTFIKFSLWLSLGFYILRLVDPKFTIH